MSRPFAVFDIDGTLVRWQLYHALVDQLVKDGFIDKTDYHKVRDHRLIWKRRETDTAYQDYERQLIKFYNSQLPSLRISDFETSLKKVISTYATQVYAFSRELINSLKAKGYFLIAISGSPQELLDELAIVFGFDVAIGSKYGRTGEYFTGSKLLASADKLAELKPVIAKHRLSLKKSFAIGDTMSDKPLLEFVERPIAFNPTAELLKAAMDNQWPIVIERKNVVYRLTPSSAGDYNLKDPGSINILKGIL